MRLGMFGPTNCSTLLLKFSLLVAALARAGGDELGSIQHGKELFVKEFVLAPVAPGPGDGLGPVFNHVSCAACHRQGALGGGGDIEFNVALLCAQLARPADRPNEHMLRVTLKALHPGFVTSDDKIIPNILLHRFGPGERYFEFKMSRGGQEIPLLPDGFEREVLQRRLSVDPLPTVKTRASVKLVRAQRNTTALFGAGLIDNISDQVLKDLADLQAKEAKVRGRVPPIGPNKVGRFGWRGQQEHLHDFVLGACANELGLEVPGNPQPINPLRPTYRPVGLDLTDSQCREITAFIAALPTPRFEAPLDAIQREQVDHGRNVFTMIGCADCHPQRMGDVNGIYSDLLLHDMGQKLADPVLAAPTLVFEQKLSIVPRVPLPEIQPSRGSMYYGDSSFASLAVGGPPPTRVRIADAQTGIVSEYRVEPGPLDREWRTPPLWGVADSAPYMHDGRAADLETAIKLHGGEGELTASRFTELANEDRHALIAFLHCLKAPRDVAVGLHSVNNR